MHFFGHSKPRFRGIWKNSGKVGTLFCACYTPGKRYVSFLLLLFPSYAACRNVIGADSREDQKEAPPKDSCMGEKVRPLSATGGERLAPLGDCPPFGALKPLNLCCTSGSTLKELASGSAQTDVTVPTLQIPPAARGRFFHFYFILCRLSAIFFFFFDVLRTFLKK